MAPPRSMSAAQIAGSCVGKVSGLTYSRRSVTWWVMFSMFLWSVGVWTVASSGDAAVSEWLRAGECA